MMKRIVRVNESGYRVGEDHQSARITDHEVELIRSLHESGGMSYAEIAGKFDIGKSTVADICRYRRRGQVAVSFRTIRIQACACGGDAG